MDGAAKLANEERPVATATTTNGSKVIKPDHGAEKRKRELAKARADLQEAQRRARAADREADKARKDVARAEEQVRSLERSKR